MGHDSRVSTELWEDVLWAQNSWGLRWGNGRGHEGETAWSHLPTCSAFAGCFSSPLSRALGTEGVSWDAKLPLTQAPLFLGPLKLLLPLRTSGRGVQDPTSAASCQHI